MVPRCGTSLLTHFVMKNGNISYLYSGRDIGIQTKRMEYPTSAEPTASLPLPIFGVKPH